MPNKKNIDSVKNLREKVAKAKSIIFADFKGLSSNHTNDLRQQMSDQGAEVSVTKNTLLKIALKEENKEVEGAAEHLKGNTVAIFSYTDAIAPLKPLVEFAKKFELPKIKAAIIDGKLTTAEQVDVISKLPSREQLISQFVGGLKSPLSGIVNVFQGNQRKLVYALKAIADKKA